MQPSHTNQPNTIVAACLAALLSVFALSATAGTLVFPPPDGATTCQNSSVPNSCAKVQFNGGSFMAPQGDGPTFYGGGQAFPYCISPYIQWLFLGAPATDASISITSGAVVDGESLSIDVVDTIAGVLTSTKTTQPFPKQASVTLPITGQAISQITVVVVNSYGTPDYDQASWAVTAMSATQPVYPTIDLSISRNGDGTFSAVTNYTFPANSLQTDRSLTLSLLPTNEEAGATYVTQSGLAVSGTLVQPLGPLDTDRTLRAVALSCDAVAEAYGSVSGCSKCKGPATSVGGPVRLFDGVMTYGETDPLPATIGLEFHREYSSGAAADGRFGLGWSSIFDASALAVDSDGKSVAVVSEDRTRAMFRLLTTGQWVQTWPQGGVAGTLTGSEALGYTFRDAGGSLVRTFGTNHQLTRIQDLRRSRAVSITHDAAGNPTSVFDESGNWSCTVTTANGHVTGISVDGRPDLAWTYSYSGSLLTSVSVAGASSAWRTYDYSGTKLSAIHDATGAILERHDYDANGWATSSYDASGDITGIQYPASDASGNATTTATRADNSQATYQQAFSAGSVVTRRADGGCTSCGTNDATAAYDTRGNLTRLQNARGYITESTYDATGRQLLGVTTAEVPSGCDPTTDPAFCRLSSDALAVATLVTTAASQRTTYVYANPNWPAKPTRITRDSVLQSGGTSAETLTYDATTGETLVRTTTGAIDSSGTQESHTTTVALYNGTEGAAFTPGGAFQSAWLTLPQPAGLRKSLDGPRTDVSDITSWVYYPFDPSVPGAWRGRLAAVRNALGQVSRLQDYDPFGHALTAIDPNGVVTTATYDPLGRPLTSTIAAVPGCNTSADPLCATDLTTTRTYGSTGGPLATEQRPAGNVTTYAYDSRGRLATLTRGTAATALERMDYTYDPTTGKKASETVSVFQGNAWVVTKTETYTYTSDGNLSSVVHADSTQLKYAYLPDGTLASVQDENHTTPNTVYAYDGMNRLSTTTQTLASASGGHAVTRYGYDIQGNLTSVTDPNGNVTTYVYDDFARLQKQTSPVSGTTSYTYDPAGNLLTSTDANGATTSRSYDALNRSLSSAATRSGATETVTWSYDDPTAGNFGIGRLAGVNEPTGSTAYQYERRGLQRTEAKTIAGGSYTTTFAYDSNGNRGTLGYPNGMAAHYTFDFADRPYSLTAGATNIVTSASYLPFGPMTSLTLGNGTTRTMRYDARYRPQENKVTSASGTLADYAYAEDNVGNITQIHDATNATYNRDFGYDDLNRLTSANTGTSLWGAGSYAYDAMGNMLSSSLGTWKTTASSLVGTTPKLSTVIENGASHAVTYDAAGNELAAGASTYAYSPRNTLASADTSSYLYDGRGVMTVGTFSVLAVNVAPGTVTGGGAGTGIVTLSVPAVSDTLISLSSSNPGVAMVPATVTVLAGQSTASFTVTAAPVSASTTVTITASFNQYTTTSLLTVLPAQLASLGIAPGTITGGSNATGTVTLTGTAAAGLVVSLSSNDSAATVPASVTVAAGSASATFTITTTAGVTGKTVTITAASNGITQTATLVFSAAELASLSVAPASVVNGGSATGTVTLTGNATTAVVIGLSVSSADAYLGNASLTIPQGSASATFSILTNLQSAASKAVTITATHGAVTRQGTLTVNPPSLASLLIAPSALVGGTSATGTATLTGRGPQNAAYSVTFSSSNTSLVATPAPIPYSATSSGQTTVLTNPVLSSTAVVVTATDPGGVRQSQAITLQPAPVTLSSLTVSKTTLIGGSSSLTGTVTLTATAPSPGIDVDLRTTSGQVYPGKFVHIPTGGNSATFTIATLPVAVNTVVTLTAIHSATTKTASVTLQIPTTKQYPLPGESFPMSVTGGSSTTGAVTLSAPPSANFTVSLQSDDPAVVSVPKSITFKKGIASQTFPVTTKSVTSPVKVHFTGSAGGVVVPIGRLLVLPPNGVTIGAVAIRGDRLSIPSGISGTLGTISLGSIVLTGPAPAGGVNVTFTGTRPNIISLGAIDQTSNYSMTTLFIPQGSTEGQLDADITPFTGIDHGTTITATYGGITLTTNSSVDGFCNNDVNCGEITVTAEPQASLRAHPSVQCASLAVAPCLTALPRAAATNAGDPSGYYLYTPELQLLAETTVSTSAAKPIAYSYLWFGGQPVASIEAATNTTRWYATDHLGTPLLQTDASGAVVWRAELTPYGDVFNFRTGAAVHQPLRFPGQIAQDGSSLYNNVFRWYRGGWGRYSQDDPILDAPSAAYRYARANPLVFIDKLGLVAFNVGPLTTHLTDNAERDCHQTHEFAREVHGCTIWKPHFECNCLCSGGLRWAAHVSIDIPQFDIFYSAGIGNPSLNYPFGRPIPAQSVLEGEMAHLRTDKALANVARERGQRLEARVFWSRGTCVAECRNWYDETARDFSGAEAWVHQNRPHEY